MLIESKKIINSLFIYLKLKRYFIFFNFSSLVLKVLNVLWEINVIKGFLKVKNKVKVFLNYNKYENFIFNVKYFSNKRSKLYINKDIFKFKTFLFKFNFFLIFIVSNSFMLLKDFLNQKKKGFIFCKFF